MNFNKTKVITVTDSAKTVRKPVLTPKIKNTIDVISKEEFDEIFVRSIFSGDANRGTLIIAFMRNKTNKEIETVFRWFCNRGNR